MVSCRNWKIFVHFRLRCERFENIAERLRRDRLRGIKERSQFQVKCFDIKRLLRGLRLRIPTYGKCMSGFRVCGTARTKIRELLQCICETALRGIDPGLQTSEGLGRSGKSIPDGKSLFSITLSQTRASTVM